MLTHIDEQGHATPPVLLSHFTDPNRAANIPEFVNARPDAITHIDFDHRFFADEIHFAAADKFAAQGDFENAIREFEKAIQADPEDPYGYRASAIIRSKQGRLKEAEQLMQKAWELAPEDRYTNWQLGQILRQSNRPEEAERRFRDAIRIDSGFLAPYLDLASLLIATPGIAERDRARAVPYARRACELTGHQNVETLIALSDSHAVTGNIEAANLAAYQALQIARQTGNTSQKTMIRSRLKRCGE